MTTPGSFRRAAEAPTAIPLRRLAQTAAGDPRILTPAAVLLLQVVCGPEDAAYEAFARVRPEYVVSVTGTVRARTAKNDKIPTGRVEARAGNCAAGELTILSSPLVPDTASSQ